MLDKSIDSALLALRRQIAREQRPGLEHVEALLRLRGVRIPRLMVPMYPVAPKRSMKTLVLEALSSGPARTREIAAHVGAAWPDMPRATVDKRTYHALDRLRGQGRVVQVRWGWWAATMWPPLDVMRPRATHP